MFITSISDLSGIKSNYFSDTLVLCLNFVIILSHNFVACLINLIYDCLWLIQYYDSLWNYDYSFILIYVEEQNIYPLI